MVSHALSGHAPKERALVSRQSLGADVEVDEALVRQHRPLLEVEVETEYPIFPGKVKFRMVRVESKRDGYIELRCSGEESFASVVLRRIDRGVQVAPLLRSAEAQTICECRLSRAFKQTKVILQSELVILSRGFG